MKCYLARHGETTFNSIGRTQGHYDARLTEKGEQQAEHLAAYLEDIDLSRIYSSTLIRAYNTAQIVAERHRGVSPTPLRSIKELNRGLASGYHWKEKKAVVEDKDIREEEWQPAFGESYIDLQDRIVPAIDRLIERNNGDICIIAHGAVNRVYLAHLMDKPVERSREIDQDNCCVNVIDAETREIELRNFTGHL